MNVAIIGAGIAGLVCAHELERHGISPVVYERNSFIGEPFSHVTAVVNVIHLPINDILKHFKKKYDIQIQPLNEVNKLVHYSPHKSGVVKGKLGYLFKRSKGEDELKVQLFSQLKQTNVIFNKKAHFEDLNKKNDYVVICSGNSAPSEELGCWQDWVKAFVKGGVVLGNFEPNTVIMWINKDYCKNGYAYLTPFDDKKASIVLVVPNVNEMEIDHYWELFMYYEGAKYSIIEEFKLEHKSGLSYPRKVGNMYLAGNAGGGIEPYLGFGLLNAVTMGAAAAGAIALGKDYEKQIKFIMERNKEMRQFRKAINLMTNKEYDTLISIVGLPGIRYLLYNSGIDVIKYGSFLSKILLRNK